MPRRTVQLFRKICWIKFWYLSTITILSNKIFVFVLRQIVNQLNKMWVRSVEKLKKWGELSLKVKIFNLISSPLLFGGKRAPTPYHWSGYFCFVFCLHNNIIKTSFYLESQKSSRRTSFSGFSSHFQQLFTNWLFEHKSNLFNMKRNKLSSFASFSDITWISENRRRHHRNVSYVCSIKLVHKFLFFRHPTSDDRRNVREEVLLCAKANI